MAGATTPPPLELDEELELLLDDEDDELDEELEDELLLLELEEELGSCVIRLLSSVLTASALVRRMR